MMSHIMASSQPPPSCKHSEAMEYGQHGRGTRGHRRGTHSEAINGGNGGLADSGHPIPASQKAATIALLEGFVLHLFNVSAGCKGDRLCCTQRAALGSPEEGGGTTGCRGRTRKGLFTAGDDNSSHLPVGLEGVQRMPQLLHQPRTERVERLGPLQPDQPHAAARPGLLHLQEAERGPCAAR